jgi:hypothetical protein
MDDGVLANATGAGGMTLLLCVANDDSSAGMFSFDMPCSSSYHDSL